MNEMKKRLIDLLFEPEQDSTDEKENVEAPLEDVSLKEEKIDIKEKPVKKETVSHYSAADLLYKGKSSVFVNLEEDSDSISETINIEKNNEKEKEDVYTPIMNISPMFGVIGEPKARVSTAKPKIDRSQITKPFDSPLGTIFSPIYGYNNANIETSEYFENKDTQNETEEYENEEIANLFDEYKDHSLDEILSENVSLFDNFDSEDK